MTKIVPVITIDGPSGSGKGTLGVLLAKNLCWNYLDSGALYRTLALVAKRKQISVSDEERLVSLGKSLIIICSIDNEQNLKIWCGNEELTQAIRQEEVSQNASRLGVLPKVREVMVSKMREFRKMPGLVTDGRDMGTVVFPDATIKFYLYAQPIVRAERRFNQLKGQGINVNLSTILSEIEARDKRDKERKNSPLYPAKDAHQLDTSHLEINQVFEAMKQIIEKEAAKLASTGVKF